MDGRGALVRAEVLSLKEREFVLAARALGTGDMNIIFRHIMINSMAPVFVSAVLGIAGAVLVSLRSVFRHRCSASGPSWGNILYIGERTI